MKMDSNFWNFRPLSSLYQDEYKDHRTNEDQRSSPRAEEKCSGLQRRLLVLPGQPGLHRARSLTHGLAR